MSWRSTVLLTPPISVLCASTAMAAPTRQIAATVITVSGRSVFLSAGRDNGVTPGDLVSIQLASGGRIEAIVQDVSATNARLEIPDGVELPQVNDRGEITITLADDKPEQPTPTQREEAPEHPPWERREAERSKDQPLLAPAFSIAPEDRPTEIHGRVFSQLRFTSDTGGGRDNDFTFSRVGTSMRVTNPFKFGGELRFSGDLSYRGADLLNRSESDGDLRIDRLSYTVGGHEHSPYRLQIGRFYSQSVPEIGLIDGAEAAIQLKDGWRLGSGLGFYPVPFPERDTGEDYGVHFFADYQSDAEHAFSSTFAYQQTWHDGEADRNLFIGRFNVRPTESLWISGVTLIDLYGSGDSVKSEDFGITELLLQARYTPTRKTGLSATYVHTTWPELLRREFALLPDELIRDGVVDRLNTSAWVRLNKNLRLTGRANAWGDQNNSGYGGEVSADWSDVWRPTSSIHSAVYFNDNDLNTGLGLRLRGRERLGIFSVSAGYDLFQYTTKGLIGGNESFTRHSLRADTSWSSGPWSYTVSGTYSFGQFEDSYSVGLYMNYRF